MHPLQNSSQSDQRPPNKPVSGDPGWFTESGALGAPSYPGADWFNHVIAEFQNMLLAQGVVFNPANDENLTQAFAHISDAIKSLEDKTSINKQNLSPLLLANTLTSKANKSALNFFNAKQATSIFGDSISHGAFAGDLFSNGWTRLLARALNGEYGCNSYGFTPYLSLGTGQDISIDLHSVSFSGSWASLDNENATNLVSGQGFRSSGSGDQITFTIPTFMKRVSIHYVTKPGGGAFDVLINGLVVGNVDTDGALNSFSYVEFPMQDNRYGSCQIKISTTNSSQVDFIGISYLSSIQESTCHNFSQSGRRLRYVGEDVIRTVCENSHTVIMALGHNDHGSTDATYQTEVSGKIDLFIQYANQHNVRVVVPDFCWSADSSNWMRILLKKLADDTNGIYVDLPSALTKDDGSIADSNYLINTLKMWADGSHPNTDGNQWVFEMVSKAMNLSCTSKRDALSLHDYHVPLQLEQAVGVENSLPNIISSVKRSSNSLMLNFYLEKEPGGAFPVGQYTICSQWPLRTNISSLQNTVHPLLAIDGSSVVGGCVISASGQVILNVTAPTIYNDLIFQVAVVQANS